MRERLEEQTEISNRQTFALLLRALRYIEPFRGRFAIKLMYGVAGLFIWPLLVPAVVDGVGSSKANQRLDTDYAAKAVSERVIQPFATLDGLVFVPMSSYSNSFSITIIDKETKEGITFTPKLSDAYTNEPRYEKVSWPQSWFR